MSLVLRWLRLPNIMAITRHFRYRRNCSGSCISEDLHSTWSTPHGMSRSTFYAGEKVDIPTVGQCVVEQVGDLYLTVTDSSGVRWEVSEELASPCAVFPPKLVIPYDCRHPSGFGGYFR